MAQQVKIANVTYNDVPLIQCPDGNGVYHQFLDTTVSSNAASSTDIRLGKSAFVNGSLITGTNAGGFIYEEGTLSPSNDVAKPSISFSNSHSTLPIFVVLFDVTGTVAPAYSTLYWGIDNWYGYNNSTYQAGSNGALCYARVNCSYFGSSNSSHSSTGYSILSLTGSTTTTMPYYLTTTGFTPYAGSNSRYYRKNRTYKWIAIWPIVN